MLSRLGTLLVAALVGVLLTACDDDNSPSPTIAADYTYDDGPYLLFDADPGTVCVHWLTASPTTSKVEYGLASRDQSAVDDTRTRLHRVCLSGLAPASTYTYALPDAPQLGEHQFTTPKNDGTTRIFVVGDMQPDDPLTDGSVALVAESLAVLDKDLWIQVGDICHTGSRLERWNRLFQAIAPLTAVSPLIAVIGNHDWDNDEGKNWASLFPFDFVDPAHGRYQSFDLDDVHLVMLDNFEFDYAMTAAQLDWLETDLDQARALGRWVFVFMHLSILSSGTSNMKFALQEQLVPLFDKYGVHGVFYGHDHMYEHYLYTYGASGLFHSPDHDWPHQAVHYWETGGGGAALEHEYGLVDAAEPIVVNRRWWDDALGDYRLVPVERHPWNPSRFVARVPETWTPGGRAYYHDSAVEPYQDDMALYGQEYGENTLHYMQMDIAPGSVTVSARYPDGVLLTGPNGDQPQEWVFSR